LAFHWRPGQLTSRPSLSECRAAMASGPGHLTSLSVGWVWQADDYGWGCRARYSDGSTATMGSASGFEIGK
jgi:hypothetical protein